MIPNIPSPFSDSLIFLFQRKSGIVLGFPCGSAVKNPSANAGDTGSVSKSERFPGGGNGNPLQLSYLENSMDRGARRATAHGVTRSWTLLSMYTHSTVSLALKALLPAEPSVMTVQEKTDSLPQSLCP
ncbi:unnamed protein product [Rangifer tarandus platyrhynchus]|uniref:Uncharacterized protein n=1 Tax=Rangifer tarandus platyrhynchus TaxID=3082113 RepID=A0AC59ZZA8_RANTA